MPEATENLFLSCCVYNVIEIEDSMKCCWMLDAWMGYKTRERDSDYQE